MAGSRVPTPNPPNFFDPDDYRLRPQIRAFITRPNDPLRYDQYLFGPQEFHDMYQSMVSVFRRYCLACPDGNFVDERVMLIKSSLVVIVRLSVEFVGSNFCLLN
ncbi:hypothetical protein H4Q26_016070 [Puccinia striiformis f. sp. tritici PST-130]|nr:hypothetical protein H4Q26_016070 [Puccinia striiformis f. sp. tritici PST-130]